MEYFFIIKQQCKFIIQFFIAEHFGIGETMNKPAIALLIENLQ